MIRARAYAAAPDAGIAIEGNFGERYDTSGIAVLENGMLFGGKYYGPEGAKEALLLCTNVPEGQAVRYFAGSKPLTRIVGNNWKLTMPAGDVTVRAELFPVGAYGAPDVRIPTGAKRIAAHAFSGIAAEVVYVPDGCGTLGAYAFANCPNLRQIRLPRDCAIDPVAFFGCPGLAAICAPDGGGTEDFAAENGYGFIAEAEILGNPGGIISVADPPEPPVVVSASAISSTAIEVSWVKSPGSTADAYRVLYNTTNDPGTSQECCKCDPGKTSVQINGLKPLTRYYFWVQAVNAAGGSKLSGACCSSAWTLN